MISTYGCSSDHEDVDRVLVIDLETEAVVERPSLTALQDVEAHGRTPGPLQHDGQHLATDPLPLVLREQQKVLQPVLVTLGPQRHAADEPAIPLHTPGAGGVEGIEESLPDPGIVVPPQPRQRRTHRGRTNLGESRAVVDGQGPEPPHGVLGRSGDLEVG